MPSEQAIKLAAAHAEPLGKFLDRRSLLVERAILDDKPYRAFDRCPASDPGTGKWRSLGTAPQTRPKSRHFSSRGGRKKLNVSRPCGANGADRSTIDTGGPDSGEKPAVVARITRDARALTFCNIQRHRGRSYHAAGTPLEGHQGMESRSGEQRYNALATSKREDAPR
jgi:hypothetical protein